MQGMLTTLTVAVVLPLKHRTTDGKSLQESQFVCCVCNVGDTLAYVYSQKSGLRELTKGLLATFLPFTNMSIVFFLFRIS